MENKGVWYADPHELLTIYGISHDFDDLTGDYSGAFRYTDKNGVEYYGQITRNFKNSTVSTMVTAECHSGNAMTYTTVYDGIMYNNMISVNYFAQIMCDMGVRKEVKKKEPAESKTTIDDIMTKQTVGNGFQYKKQGSLSYYVEENYRPDANTAQVIREYILAFEGLPGFLKNNVAEVAFLTDSGWREKSNSSKSHLASTDWNHPDGMKSPIYINLGEATSIKNPTFYNRPPTVAAHEAGHALDGPWTYTYSGNQDWKDLIRGKESAIYYTPYPEEVFAGAIARYVTKISSQSLKSISPTVYNYIAELFPL